MSTEENSSVQKESTRTPWGRLNPQQSTIHAWTIYIDPQNISTSPPIVRRLGTIALSIELPGTGSQIWLESPMHPRASANHDVQHGFA